MLQELSAEAAHIYQVGMFRRTVYHRMLALQQFLRQAESCTKPEGRVIHQRSCSCITKLTAAVVSCNDEPDDEAFLGVLERAP